MDSPPTLSVPPQISDHVQSGAGSGGGKTMNACQETNDSQLSEKETTTATKDEQNQHQHTSLHHSLLGPSLLKAGQEKVDQRKVAEIIYQASVGSKFFEHESRRDSALTQKISQILSKKNLLETKTDLSADLRRADQLLSEYEADRDLSQFIVHVDCDAFYASVEELERPELKSVPMAVGKGIICTCNYRAREYGVRSGMAGHIAKKLCPGLVFIPLNFEKYMRKAEEVRKVLQEYDPTYEAAGCDEAYLNITAYCTENDVDPEIAVEELRREVKEKTSITVSAGIAPNVRLAKIVSNRNKPNGQFRIGNDRDEIMRFMAELPVRKVNGVGRVFERELESVGIKACGDIYPMRGMLSKLFGEKAFKFLLGCYLGIGRTKIQPAEEYERKSIGTENTFPDLWGGVKLRERLRTTAEELERDLKQANLSGKTLVLKIKMHNYQVHSRQRSLPCLVKSAEEIYKFSLPLLVQFETEFGDKLKIRLMGLRVTSLVDLSKGIKNRFFEKLEKKEEVTGKRKRSENDFIDDNEGGEQWEIFTDEEEHLRGDDDGKPFMQTDELLKEKEKEEKIKWPCPLCSKLIAADDRVFNEHVDFCLSKDAIREVVYESSNSTLSVVSSPSTGTSSSISTSSVFLKGCDSTVLGQEQVTSVTAKRVRKSLQRSGGGGTDRERGYWNRFTVTRTSGSGSGSWNDVVENTNGDLNRDGN